MAHRTLQVVMIAYNLIRLVMQQAAPENSCSLSFRSCVDVVVTNHVGFQGLAGSPLLLVKQRTWMRQEIASRTLPHRPGRTEPRVKKRRPRNYSLLTKPRDEYEEYVHRSRYRKAA